MVLVTALLLVGLFAATVLAQGAPRAPSSMTVTVDGAAVSSGTDLLEIPFENLDTTAALVPAVTADPNASPPVVGFDNPRIINGPTYDADNDPATAQVPLFTVDTTNAGGGATDGPRVGIQLVSGATEANLTGQSSSPR